MDKVIKYRIQKNPKYPDDARREVMEIVVAGFTEPAQLEIDGYDVERTGTMSMSQVCKKFVGMYLNRNKGIPFPCQKTIMAWLKEDSDIGRELAKAHDDAVEVRADMLNDLKEEIAFDNSGDTYHDDKGNRMVNSANVQRAKLILDYLTGASNQMNPKKYSEKLKIDATLEVHTIVGMEVK